jgi:hypothetical protein
MGQTVLGIVLVVLGVIAIAAGIGGGIAQMVKELKKRAAGPQAGGLLDLLPTETLKAFTEFVKTVGQQPTWVALVAVGILLVFMGGRVL